MNLIEINHIRAMQIVEQERCRKSILETCTIEQIMNEPHLKIAMGW
jgi:hypothetical protein